MTFKLSFSKNKSGELSNSSISLTKYSDSVFENTLASTTSLHSSSIGATDLIRPSASKSNAIRIRKSGFSDSRRVGRRENDPRYYRFTLRRSGRIDISILNREFSGLLGFAAPTLQVRLERSNGRTLNRRTVEGGELELISRRLDRNNTYYIRVSSSGRSVPYRLGLRTRNGAELFR